MIFTALSILNNNFAVTRQNNAVALGIDNQMFVFQFQHTGKRNFNRSLFGRLGSRTTDVEGSHRQLGTRFTD